MARVTNVPVAPASPERFRDLIGAEFSQVEDAIRAAGDLLAGRVIWHVNSTARGGGVAEMLRSLLAYARGAGVDARWLTIDGDDEFFRVTKRIHNHLHEASGDGGELGHAEHEIYERGLLEAADQLTGLFKKGDIVYIHDPQPAGLVAHVKSAEIPVIWRCHVGVDQPRELARGAWNFMRRYIEDADAYVFSRREFAWEGLEKERLWLVPPSIDAFSPKNQDLAPEAVKSILDVVGIGPSDHFGHAVYRRQDGSPARVDRAAVLDQEGPIPTAVPLIAQVSRWDRLKDPIGLLRCFTDHIPHSDSHLVLVGPSVAEVSDDPEGEQVLAEVRTMREQLPEPVRRRVHLACLPMDNVEENAAMVNAIQRRADVVVQKSLAEGFGLTVAEAMWKAKPVVAGRVGGIQDQIVDGESGVLVNDPADLEAVGAAIASLIDDPSGAERIGVAARERVRQHYLGSRHLVLYMRLIGEMLDNG